MPTSTSTFILSSLFLVLSATSIYAQCLEGNCHSGEGIFKYHNGQRFSGSFKNGLAHGEGTLFYTNGERHIGQFINGLPHGNGRHIYPDGRSRTGTWFEGELANAQDNIIPYTDKGQKKRGCVSGDCNNGQGSFAQNDGSIYVGAFSNGNMNGYGICNYADGSKYEGQWQNGRPHGQGHKTWPDGRTFTGQWQAGKAVSTNGVFDTPNFPLRNMQGKLIVQSGCIQGDCNNGYGVYSYADGSRYEGHFRSGQPHGKGTFFYPNGDKHTGEFAYGLAHGQGERLYTDGKRLDGQWLEGGYVQPPSRHNTTGCQNGNCINGFGTYIFKQGDHYEGSFTNGLPHGNGIVNYANGDRYEGSMINGSFGGYGTYYESNGAIYQGHWENGKYMGNRASVQQATAATAPTPSMKTWALIIGVSSYTHMPALRFPDDDAYRLFAFLKSPEGGAIPDERINILVDEDATKVNIINAMNKLFAQAQADDLIVLYFSGHGLPGAFLPIDYDGLNNTLTHTEIKQILNRSRAGYKLCLADACHSGSLLAARGKGLPSLLSTYYENLANSKKGTALIMSSKAEETSLESSGLRQGVFTHFLLRGLKGEADQDKDGVVRVQELYAYVDQQVKSYTANQQSPVIQGDYDRRMPVAVLR